MCSWVKIKVLPLAGCYTYNDGDEEEEEKLGKGKVVLSDLAITVIRQWGEVFCGFGAYSVQEVVFLAGLCLSKYAWLEN